MFDKEMFRQYRQLNPGEFIICAVDTSGEGQDWCAAQFLSKNRLDVPLVLHYEGSIIDVTPALKLALEMIHDMTGVNPCVAYETNNGGGYEFERLGRLNKLQKYTLYHQYRQDERGRLERSEKLGWNTNSATRSPMLQALQEVIKQNLITVYDKLTVDEMFSFVKHRTPSGWRSEAETGAHDDLIMSLAIAWQLYQTESPPAQRVRRHKVERKRSKFHI